MRDGLVTSLAESPDWRISVAEANGPDRHDSNAPVRALIVDSEPLIRELMSIALRHEGWKVATAGDGATALRSARQTAPDIVVLDVELPDMDGLEVMRALREQTRGLPVLFLSARASVEDRIAGLEHGCDDYVSKPFSLQEVVLRLRALSNRSAAGPEVGGRLRIGDLVLDERSLEVARAGRTVALSFTEFRLLRYLMRNSGRVVSKTDILQEVWGSQFARSTNLVELFISYLRKKVDAGHPPMIHTLRGAGYILKQPARVDSHS
ncbi:two-component system, OmpR family, response regulator [Mycolicibacterium fluoranthenivorans]|jgi:two-component system OmpR family response regulator|uniref:Two-component system, OmpR family, response regulator n=1 Tax=Mycolicibacterium fluoranthenivorans TaxID=258505 RepID=A0A1G4V2U2_9MYCO|nr:two-component system, OmpR family, response regulator [Mycolicibacterium fluoranthenivorans]